MTIQPQIKWAQRKNALYVTVEVLDATDVNVDFQEKQFSVNCKTPSGEVAEVKVDLYDAVKPEECRWMNSRGVVLHLTKAESKRWPNISPAKPKNVKVDWAKWMDTDDEEEADGKGDFDMSQFGGMGGMGGLGGMGGMDFSQFGGMPDLGNMPDFGDEDDDDEEDEEGDEQHEHGPGCQHGEKPVAAENAENQPTATA